MVGLKFSSTTHILPTMSRTTTAHHKHSQQRQAPIFSPPIQFLRLLTPPPSLVHYTIISRTYQGNNFDTRKRIKVANRTSLRRRSSTIHMVLPMIAGNHRSVSHPIILNNIPKLIAASLIKCSSPLM